MAMAHCNHGRAGGRCILILLASRVAASARDVSTMQAALIVHTKNRHRSRPTRLVGFFNPVRREPVARTKVSNVATAVVAWKVVSLSK